MLYKPVQFKKLGDDAIIPTRSHKTDAGWDLYAAEDKILLPLRVLGTEEYIHNLGYTHPALDKTQLLVSTQIAMKIPEGCFGKIEDRSSMALKGIKTAGGVIDSGYRGEVKVILYNHTPREFIIKKGDRIAQIVFHAIPMIDGIEVEKLEDSTRGEGGFGSTGK